MTPKKKNKEKEDDLDLIKKQMRLILGDASMSGVAQQAKVKAGSLLARIHLGAKLGADPTEEKIKRQKIEKPKLRPEIKEKLDDILG